MTVSVEGDSPVGLAMQADTSPPAEPKVKPVEEESSVCQTISVPELDNPERKWKVHELFPEGLENPALSQDQQEKLLSLLEEFHDVFIKVHIDISDTPLKTQPVRRLPFAVHQEVAQ